VFGFSDCAYARGLRALFADVKCVSRGNRQSASYHLKRLFAAAGGERGG